MFKRKLSLFIATFSYGGNGGLATTSPKVCQWITHTLKGMDDRIGERVWRDFVDTPIPMLRNAAVLAAREWGADLMLMVDSDTHPDVELAEDSEAKPFWDTSLDFIYDNYDKGPHVVAAPYCGPPPLENVYVFTWANMQSDHPNADFTLRQFAREEAQCRAGIEDVAALPTGLILYDMRAFDLTEPKENGDRPWFYYEYKDLLEAEKCSTEDVTATRDMALVGCQKLGYNPINVNWDAWAGHIKQKVVRKPRIVTSDMVAGQFARAVVEGREGGRKHMIVDTKFARQPKPNRIVEALHGSDHRPAVVPAGKDS